MGDTFIAEAKLLRLLMMIEYLKKDWATIEQLSKRYDISTRTAQRYIKLFEAVGFTVSRLAWKYHITGTPDLN